MAEDDFNLDEEFPLGDGTAEDSADVACPYCGETVSIAVDPGSGSFQQYVEDCEVCCNPWQVSVRFSEGTVRVEVARLNA
ncbi:MAG: CPXCG motif-containing cysteine-rich protein [Gemmatimonadaceae bacterium]|nr:CPXCG motif-containing cysteine-rich protein [Gemmatimonadaceae bacterium]